MAHRTNPVQMQFVAVLTLLALFTHNHVFWIAALLLALVELPDFTTPMYSMAESLEKLVRRPRPGDTEPEPPRGSDTIQIAGPVKSIEAPSEGARAMLELLLCSMITIFPDYLYRSYVQGKRIGREINLYTMWYELRWGITLCLILTISLITTIFYFHPSTSSASMLFRTVTILPETGGRVDEVFVKINEQVDAGAPLFRLDSSQQEAAVEAARRHVSEVDAEMTVAKTELAGADGVSRRRKAPTNRRSTNSRPRPNSSNAAPIRSPSASSRSSRLSWTAARERLPLRSRANRHSRPRSARLSPLKKRAPKRPFKRLMSRFRRRSSPRGSPEQ